MTSRFACRILIALGLVGPALAAQQTSPPPEFGEVIEVNVVNVEVYVTDKAGNPVKGLKRGDFELFEDGRKVEVTNFEAIDRELVQIAAAPNAPQMPASAAPAAPQTPQTAPEERLNLIVYVDNFNIRPTNRAKVLQSLQDFLQGQLAPGDRVMLVTNDLGRPRVRVPFTADPAVLTAGLDEIGRLSANGGEIDRSRRTTFEAIMNLHRMAYETPIDLVPCDRELARLAHGFAASVRSEVLRTLGAMKLMVNSLAGIPGRKALLHVSDGIPLTPGEEMFQLLIELCGGAGATSGFGDSGSIDALPTFDAREIGPQAYQAASEGPADAQSYSTANELTALTAHANAHQVTLYTLQASGLIAGGDADSPLGDARYLQFPTIRSTIQDNLQGSLFTLANETGGRPIFNTNDFSQALTRMREDFSSYYSLGYSSPRQGDGRQHRIEVKVRKPGLKVRHRTGYRDKSSLERTADRTLAAVLHGVEDNPLDVTVQIGEQTLAEKGQ
ncbi:MAG TPA: VWA domain-containing protein, partial [Thermoanaerobaculia bacterium]|nr:VWA domain-containing protein [Thermoanaerobaculia bacterium]